MAADTRRSTAAAAFYMEDEEPEAPNVPTYDRVVELLNQASLMQKDALKVTTLKIVKELIVMKEPGLLDNFLDEMLAFQTDRSQDVRKFIVSFIEDAIKQDPEVLTKTMGNINLMMEDESVAVVKKVILSMCQIYNTALKWMCTSKTQQDVKKRTWNYVQTLKNKIMEMLDSENDGVRTHAIKFLETVVITLSAKTPDSDIPKNAQKMFSLDQIPDDGPQLKLKKLDEDGKAAFYAVIGYQGSAHISSVNLMTCMGSLTTIAKQRPQFMAQVVQGNETLHVNLPPTLAKSQVSSVRKNLKMQMLQLLKHPASFPHHNQITTLLTDLGATQTEVMKAMPKVDRRKRKPPPEDLDDRPMMKKTKLIPMESPAQLVDKEEEDDYMAPASKSSSAASTSAKQEPKPKGSALDQTAEDLIHRLTPQNVADLVLLSMVMLPDTMPAQFQSTYTPIAAAGTDGQIKHLSRLLATQLMSAGLGAAEEETQKAKGADLSSDDDDDDDNLVVGGGSKQAIQTLVGGATPASATKEEEQQPPAMPVISAPPRKGVKMFRLAAVTEPLDHNLLMKHSLNSFKRILHVEKFIQVGKAPSARLKIITSLVAQFGGLLKTELEEYIFEDARGRADLAMAWLYQEYANFQGYNVTSTQDKPSIAGYDECLTRLLAGLLSRPDKKEGLFSRIILEAPLITANAIAVLRKYCQEETRIYLGMTTLKELIVKRPCMKLEFLDVLLDFTSHDTPDVRNNAIRVTKKLHERTDLKAPIERYALYHLKLLLQPTPPEELFGPDKGRPMNENSKWLYEEWNEDTMKLCLWLYLGLLPVNQKLVHELAEIYTCTTADIKRTILRMLEIPVRGMGMQSPELLTLVEQCPKGAETLVTRIIHILTDKSAPSPELVERVRDLYHKRVSDVRFLIPVLTGLTKQEVVNALPKIIKLNPVVVKEVFNRLLLATVPAGMERTYTSPVTPADLLVALHNIDPNKCDMKTIIKATNMCFAEKSVYSQEVLALVMQQLMDLNTLPTLLMRTVIQSLAMYPKLIGFVMNIMQRLINKQVWKHKKVWEGFVKCCQRTKPHCFQVLLLLPAVQLKNCFELAPDLREPLHKHIQAFTPHQRAHIPKAIMSVLEKKPASEEAKQSQPMVIKIEPDADEDEKNKKKKITIELSLDKEKASSKVKDDPDDVENRQLSSDDSKMDTTPAPEVIKIKEEPVSPPHSSRRSPPSSRRSTRSSRSSRR